MINRFASRALLTTALAASMTFSGYTPAVEAMPAKPLGLNDATPSLVETVQSRRRYARSRRNNNAAGAAIALGVLGLAAGAIAANQRRDYYYGDPYYADPYYAAPPRYYGQRYGYYDQPRRYYRQYRAPRGYYAPNRGYYPGGPAPQNIPDNPGRM